MIRELTFACVMSAALFVAYRTGVYVERRSIPARRRSDELNNWGSTAGVEHGD